MARGLLGKKIGMSQVFDQEGNLVPVTVLELGPNHVIQVKTADGKGGYNAIKDVYKTWVYRLARFRNTRSDVIPARVIERPPSAELRADQADTDTLPDYDVLDPIIEAYVERGESIEGLCALGYAEADVRQAAGLIRRNEYKRRQAAPGPKVTHRAFGRDRRYPITHSFRSA